MHLFSKSIKVILLLISFVLLFIYGCYFYGLSKVEPYLIKSDHYYSTEINESVWVSFGGGESIEQIEISPLEYIFKLIIRPSKFHASIRINSQAVRAQIYKHEVKNSINHISNISGTIWMSKNFQIKDAISIFLDNANYGNDVYGLEAASKFYFDKNPSQLNTNQLISVLIILRGPSYFRIECPKLKDRRLKYAKIIEKRLKANWPDKYADYQYEEPILADRDFPEC